MEYGIRWTECNRRNQITSKEKTYTTEKARDKAADRIAAKDGFIRFDAWLN